MLVSSVIDYNFGWHLLLLKDGCTVVICEIQSTPGTLRHHLGEDRGHRIRHHSLIASMLRVVLMAELIGDQGQR